MESKLPKKYAGITPGPWRIYDWGNETAVGVTPVSSSFSDVANCDIDTDERTFAEKLANATIMADAPKMAADIVKLREALLGYLTLNEQINSINVADEEDVKDWCRAMTESESQLRAILDQTKEYEA